MRTADRESVVEDRVSGTGTWLTRLPDLAVFLLALSPWAAVAAEDAGTVGSTIKVGDEVLLMSDDRPGKAKRGRPAVAFGNDVFLVAWQEGWQGDGGNSRIHAVRVGLDGKMLDASGIEIAPCKTGVQENPRVAFFVDAFLVVWQDMRNGRDCDVLGARVSPEGKVLDEKPIFIAAGPRTQAMPDVAADDRSFMVVWHGFQGEETIPSVFAARIGADGAAGPTAAVTEGSAPRIAFSGKDYLVTCFDARRSGDRLATFVKYVGMDADGKELFQSTYRENVNYSYSRRISACGVTGKGWVLVCSRALPDYWGWSGPAAQRAYRITPEGKRAADSPSEQYYDPQRKLRIVPANWLDTSIGKETHRAAGPAGIPEIWPWGDSALAADGPYCVAVWQRYHTGGFTGIDMVDGDIQAGRVDGWKPLDGQGGVPLAASAASELNPALAGNGSGVLLCVYEKSLDDGTKQICARTMETGSAKAH